MKFNNKAFLIPPKFNGNWWLAKKVELVEWDITTDTKYITNVKEIYESDYYNLLHNENIEVLPRFERNVVII